MADLSVGGLEIELKAGLEPRHASLLAQRLTRRAGPAEHVSLNAVYHDTADRSLQAAGIALRVRQEGRQWIQAAKWGRTGHGGFQQLNEVECRLFGAVPDIARFPDPALRTAILSALGSRALEPWFATRVRRRTWQVRDTIGLVEVAIDRGTIEAGSASEAVLEAEFELKEGSPEAVFRVAAQLLGDVPADLLLPGKAKRGVRLAEGGRRKGAERRKPSPGDPGRDGAAAWEGALALQATVVAAELHRLFTSDEPEGPHQLRVGLRRLRAAERLFRPLLEPAVAAEIAEGARTMGRLVAPLRDSDVMIETIRADSRLTLPLARALTDAGAAIREDVRQDLRRNGATAFAIRLLQLANIGGWRPDGRGRAPLLDALSEAALQARWKRLAKLGDRLSTLNDEEQHAFRKGLKKARYLMELQRYPDAKEFKSHLKKLQESLGLLNDLSVLSSWSPELSEEANGLFDTAREALLRTAGSRADAALGRACRHWRTLRALPQPWVLSTAP